MDKLQKVQVFALQLAALHHEESAALEKEDGPLVDFEEEFAKLFEQGLVEYGLDVVLDGIDEFGRAGEWVFPSTRFGQLAIVLAEQGKVAEARRAADRMNEDDCPDGSRIHGLIFIAQTTRKPEDVTYAQKEAQASMSPAEYAGVLIDLAHVARHPGDFIEAARRILHPMIKDENTNLQEVAPALIRLSKLTQLESDLLTVVRVLNDSRLVNSSSYHVPFEYTLVMLKDHRLALRIAARIRDQTWRSQYQRSINKHRRDLN